MQDQLDLEHPELHISIAHVNAIGHESGLDDLAAVTDLPIVDDDETALVWDAWGAEWRDVYVLDGDNVVYAVYNLTTYSLAEPENYQALYALFVEAAGG